MMNFSHLSTSPSRYDQLQERDLQIPNQESASSLASMPGGQILTIAHTHTQLMGTSSTSFIPFDPTLSEQENTLQQDQITFSKQGPTQATQQSHLQSDTTAKQTSQQHTLFTQSEINDELITDLSRGQKVSEDLQENLENRNSNHIINSNSQLNAPATSSSDIDQATTLSTTLLPQQFTQTKKPLYALQLPQLRVFRLPSQGKNTQEQQSDKTEEIRSSPQVVQTQSPKRKSNNKSNIIQEEVKASHNNLKDNTYNQDSAVRNWFSSLSEAEKQLACSVIDPEISKCIIDMELRSRQMPESNFKIFIQQSQQGCDSFEAKSNIRFEPQEQILSGRLDLGSCLNFGLTSNPGQSIILHQKELLDYTRFTYVSTPTSLNEEEPSSAAKLSNDMNTLTISQLAFADGNDKLLQLADRILDKRYLSKPLQVELSESGEIKSLALPEWVDVEQFHGRAYWILAFTEIAIQINFLLANRSLESKCQVSPINQLIDRGNKIYQSVRELNQKYSEDIGLKQSNSEEFRRLFERGGQSSADNFDFELLLMLFVNQSADMFANNLVLTQIENIDTSHFECCRYFSQVLLGLGESKCSDSTTKKALKNQKKKNKRKLKKAQQLQQQEEETKPAQPNESKEEQKILHSQDESQVDQDFRNLLVSKPLNSEVSEGKSLFKKCRKESHKGESHRLLTQEHMIAGTLESQDILSDSCIFQLFEGDFKDNNEDNRSHSREGIDKISSFSESTVDILGNFSSNYQSHLKSPQHSTNTQIELEMHKNIYSSDAGDSNSIQLQKQFSDYCLAKGELSSNINNDESNKLRESLDNLQVDVSLSNDTCSAIKQEDCNSKNLSATKKQPSPVAYSKPVSKFGSSQKPNQVWSRNQPDLEEEEKSSKFEIIRSQQSYIQDQQIQRQQQNQRKKKNKSAKKPAPTAQASQNQLATVKPQIQQRNMSAQSNILNSFMRKKFQPSKLTLNDQEEENFEEDVIEEQEEQSENTVSSLENPEGTESSRGNLNYQDAISQSFKPKQPNSKQQNQQIYVKKGQLSDQTVPLVKTLSTNSRVQKNQEQQPKTVANANTDQSSLAQSNGKKKASKGSKGKQGNANPQWDRGATKKKTSRGKGNSGGNHVALSKQNSYFEQSNYDPLTDAFGQLTLNRSGSAISDPAQIFLKSLEMIKGIDLNEISRIWQNNQFQNDLRNAQYQNSGALKGEVGYMNEDHEGTGFYGVEQDEATIDPKTKALENFFELFEAQMVAYKKRIEKRLESVRKERENAIQIIRNIVNSLYKEERNSVAVRLYGSMASNLSIETSDVDLAVVGLDFQGCKERQIAEMKRLVDQISLIMKNSTKAKLIDTATVPVIKLEVDLVEIAKKQERSDRTLGSMSKVNQIDAQMRFLGIDITFEETVKTNCYYGVQGENLSRISLGIQCINYIKELCMKIPGLQTIVLILKKLLHAHDLNQTFTGGLNSYSVVLMTAAYLQKFHQVKSISKNIMEFLNFYGSFFDPQNTMISVEIPYYISFNSFTQHNLMIADPLSKTNNPGRGAYQIMRVKQVFQRAYDALHACQSDYLSYQKDIDIIQVLLGTEQSEESSLNSHNSSGNKSNHQL